MSEKEIESCQQPIDALYRIIRPLHLDRRQYQYLSSFTFDEGPEIAEAVADGLERRGGLFPEVPVRPADLRSGLNRAFLLLSVRDQLAGLVAQVDEHYRLERGLTVKRALEVLKHYRADQRRFFRTAMDDLRWLALEPAEWLVQRWITGRTGR